MRYVALIFALFLPFSAYSGEKTPRFAVFYTDSLPSERFMPYDTLVFDADHHPPLGPLAARGKALFGYISLAEGGDYRRFTPQMKALGLSLGPIPGTKEHYYIDVRKPAWAAMVVETLIPQLIRQGFDGVMLDTADTADVLENKGKPYQGMNAATLQLIRAIRMHYPEMKIMLNRGFALLPDAASEVDALLAESIYTTINAKGEMVKQPEAHYRSVAAMLNGLKQQRPALELYALDYWYVPDTKTIKEIYATQRASGLVPYVATPDLQKLVSEPE